MQRAKQGECVEEEADSRIFPFTLFLSHFMAARADKLQDRQDRYLLCNLIVKPGVVTEPYCAGILDRTLVLQKILGIDFEPRSVVYGA